MVQNKETLYARVSPKNAMFLEKEALKLKQTKSYCIDAYIDAIRLGKQPKLEVRETKSVKGVKAHKARIQKLKDRNAKRKEQKTGTDGPKTSRRNKAKAK